MENKNVVPKIEQSQEPPYIIGSFLQLGELKLCSNTASINELVGLALHLLKKPCVKKYLNVWQAKQMFSTTGGIG